MVLPLVVVPGMMEDAAGWEDALAGCGREVVVVPNSGDTISAMAQALLERAPGRFLLLGHSLGGYVALEAVLAAPERVVGLVLVSTSARGETEAGRTARAQLVEAARTDPSGTFARLACASLARENRAAHGAAVEQMLRAGGIARFEREQRAAAGRAGFAARLREIACPTLIVTGAEDGVVPGAASDEMCVEITGARLVRLSGCGHMPQIEAPGAFLDAIRTFAADVPA